MNTTNRTDTARRIFQGQWISKLLGNFETTDEVQQISLAVLWSVLETGYMRTAHILQTMDITPEDEISTTFVESLGEIKLAVSRIEIPVDGKLLPLMVKDESGTYKYNSELSEWETEIVDAIQDRLPMIFPSHVPAVASEKQYVDGTWVIKHSVRAFKDQSERTAPEVFKALNVLNQQAYRLNTDMIRITNLVEDLDRPIGGSQVHRLNRIKTMKAFTGVFHFKYTMDFRARIYARSVLATPQGDSFSKALLDLSVAKELGRHGVQALAIHFANQSDMDKESYKERINWAMTTGKTLASKLNDAHGDWMIIGNLLTEQDNFEQYTAAMDWHRCINSLDPTLYRSSIICHQDATNSGFQFGAALLKDREAAEHVNITSTKTASDKPADLYRKMAEAVIELLEHNNPIWLIHIDRKFCKKPIMVTGYGAGEKVVQADIEVYMKEKGIDLDFEDIKDQFFAALESTVGSMVHITKAMKEHAKTITEEHFKDVIQWNTPDGFKVYHQYRDTSARKVSIGTKKVIKNDIEETISKISAIRARRKGEIDPLADKMVGALPPNFIHSMDGQMLRYAALSASNANIAFCPIHDSFGTHAADYWNLHTILKESFVKTMSFDWYGQFCESNDVRPTLEIMGDYDVHEALKAAYIFS